ncbi:MAG: MBL fold metallo-hydrolase [Myxococcales bacterium]|nr:MBL fold metallo-hydrolase [Myxococcales bacterium]
MIAACRPPAPTVPGPSVVVAPHRPDEPDAPDGPDGPGPVDLPPAVTWRPITQVADLPRDPPAPGTWRVHLIDVGTGLALLVQGADFRLLYDAGSGDPGERPVRVLDYLAAAIGPSGDGQCASAGSAAPTRRTIDHVVLSHPHLDHGSALDLVLHCYQVDDIWDSGRINDAVFYRDFLTGVAEASGARYHTAALPPADRTLEVKGLPVIIPTTVTWEVFDEGDRIVLGADAAMTILHAEAKARPDPNENTIVLAVELGRTRLLLAGDAESGPRADPSAALGDIEAHLVEEFAAAIDADILQVGHHGSKTSSRAAFLAAVSPTLALVSAGPKLYGGVRLPDDEVIAALAAVGATVLRTDLHDATCPGAPKIGPARGPGGCESWLIDVVDRPAP